LPNGPRGPGGVTRATILYRLAPAQIAGILPSNTPVGSGTIVVTNNGRAHHRLPPLLRHPHYPRRRADPVRRNGNLNANKSHDYPD